MKKSSKKKKKTFTILGAGISGLSCGFELVKSKDVKLIVLEKQNCVGGVCGSFRYKDFTLDYGPHKIYSQIEGLMDYFKSVIGEETLKVKKRNSLYVMDKYFRFPLSIPNLISNISVKTVTKGTHVFFSFFNAKLLSMFRKNPLSYQDYLKQGFGKAGYNLMFRDYAWKVWGAPYKLSSEIAKKRIPVLSISELIKSAVMKKDKPKISAEFFYYPKNGVGTVCDNLKKEISKKGAKVHLNSLPTKINIVGNRINSVTFKQGSKTMNMVVDYLISTIPLRDLVKVINPKPSVDIIHSAEQLKQRDLIVIYLFFDKELILKNDNWIFFPGKEVIFNRVSEQKSFSEFTCPKGKTALMVEITCGKNDKISEMSDKEILNIALRDMYKVNVIKKSLKPFDFKIIKMENTYPVYSLDYKKHLSKVLSYLKGIQNLYSVGRQGLFNYNNMDHCVDMCTILAKHLLSGKGKEDWEKFNNRFDNYKIVD